MKIRFVVDNITSGSTVMRGVMFSEVLKAKGFDCEVVKDYINIKDSILVFIGALIAAHNLTEEKLYSLKKNNNKVVLDPVDYIVWAGAEEISLYRFIDGFILNNHFTYRNLNLSSAYIAVPHTFDPRLNEYSIEKSTEFNVAYLGTAYLDTYLQNPPEWLYGDFDLPVYKLLPAAIHYNAHFSHRSTESKDFLYKPCTKLALASATNSLFITSRDKSVIEYLPEDYPFYIDEDREKTQVIYEKAKSIYRTQEWTDLVGFISSLKPKFDINNISSDYIKLFNTL